MAQGHKSPYCDKEVKKHLWYYFWGPPKRPCAGDPAKNIELEVSASGLGVSVLVFWGC